MYQDGQLKTEQGRIYDPKFGFQRMTLRSNVDVLVTKAMTISMDMSAGITDQAQPYSNTSVFTNMNRIPSWIMPAYYTDADGNRLYAGTTDFPEANPMYMLATKGTYRKKNNTINTSIKLSYDFSQWIKGLSASVRGAYDSNFGNYGQWTETQSTYQLISQPGRTDRYVSFLEPVFYATSSGSVSSTRKIYGEARLNYKLQLGSHNVTLSGVSNISDYRSGSALPYKSVSFIGIFNYSYKNRYFLEANAAYRGSENFAPGRRFGLFPSVSAAWNVHGDAVSTCIDSENICYIFIKLTVEACAVNAVNQHISLPDSFCDLLHTPLFMEEYIVDRCAVFLVFESRKVCSAY